MGFFSPIQYCCQGRLIDQSNKLKARNLLESYKNKFLTILMSNFGS
jgi:hypothetical protein